MEPWTARVLAKLLTARGYLTPAFAFLSLPSTLLIFTCFRGRTSSQAGDDGQRN